VNIEDRAFPVLIKPVPDGYNIRKEGGRIYIRSTWNLGGHLFSAIVNGRKVNVKIEPVPTGYILTHSGTSAKVFVRSPRMSELEALMTNKNTKEEIIELTAPLSGQIVAIKVKEGDQVTLGQDIMVLTAMKMENIITSEREGKIAKIFVSEKDQVSAGKVLLEFEG